MPQAAIANPHVAVLAFPFGTHGPPLLAIVHHLATHFPHTHFSFFGTAASNNSIFSSFYNNEHITMPRNLKAYDVWDGVPERYVFERKPQEAIELFVKAANGSFSNGVAEAEAETGRKVSCLVSDAFFWFAAEMAEEMKVSWVAFWTAGPCSISAHFYTDSIRNAIGLGDISGREDEALNFIPGMSEIRARDLPEGVVTGRLDSIFSNMLYKMGLALLRATAVFINSFEELDPVITSDLRSKFKKFLNIGPINFISPPPPAPVQDAHGCIPWLQTQQVASVAYVSFGSVTLPPSHELVALAEAIEDRKIPFIWSLNDKSKVHLPDGFIERTKPHGLIVPWAPQPEVLAHKAVGVFITHCGWNSVVESIAGGVPMICRPFFGDQRLNARMVEDVWKVGLTIEGGAFIKSGAVNCLDEIFSAEKGKKIRDSIGGLKELARTAIGTNGSSSRNLIALSNLVSGTSH